MSEDILEQNNENPTFSGKDSAKSSHTESSHKENMKETLKDKPKENSRKPLLGPMLGNAMGNFNGGLNNDLKSAINTWDVITEQSAHKVSPENEQLQEIKNLLSELKSKLAQFRD